MSHVTHLVSIINFTLLVYLACPTFNLLTPNPLHHALYLEWIAIPKKDKQRKTLIHFVYSKLSKHSKYNNGSSGGKVIALLFPVSDLFRRVAYSNHLTFQVTQLLFLLYCFMSSDHALQFKLTFLIAHHYEISPLYTIAV